MPRNAAAASPARPESLAEIERLYDQGVRNIDIGCMQVYLHYHGHAFKNFEEMLDPSNNVAYAALLLKKLYHDARSWSVAITRYHYWTPKFSRIYHNKVKDAWGTARRVAYEDRRVADDKIRRERRAMKVERRRLQLMVRSG